MATQTLSPIVASPVVIGRPASSFPGTFDSKPESAPPSVSAVERTPRVAAGSQADEGESISMPPAFGWYLIVVSFMFAANYTIVLPTAHAYAASLGADGWFAGLIIATSLAPGLATVPLGPVLFRRSYKRPLLALALSFAFGNCLYGLGQLAGSRWLLLTGAFFRGVLWGACGQALAQDALFSCCGKRGRSSWTALLGNMGFLGMGMGPVFAAGLSQISFSIGLLDVDEFTNPGWFFCVVWMVMFITLLFIKEPERHFARNTKSQGHALDTSQGAALDLKIKWCLLVVFTTSLSVAAWESSAAIVTQIYFGWSVSKSSLFMGAVFFVAALSGEGIRTLLRSFSVIEADVVVSGVVAAMGGSALLYWYFPSTAIRALVTANEFAYILGSCVVLCAANSARNYAATIAMRAATSQGSRAMDLANTSRAAVMMLGRAAGAFAGMGVATLPGGAEGGAGLVTAASALALSLLMAPRLLSDLRQA